MWVRVNVQSDKSLHVRELRVRVLFSLTSWTHLCRGGTTTSYVVSILPLPHSLLARQSESSARVVNTLLTELDGLDTRKSVFVIAATNRPDMIDPAMCRPGRLDKLLYVDLPKAEERADITRTLLRKTPLGPRGSEDETRAGIEHLVRERADGWSGADLAALVREAAVRALKRRLTERRSLASPQGVVPDEEELFVSLEDFQYAFGKIVPSVSPQQRRKYEYLQRKMGNAGIPIPEAKGEEGGQAPAAEPGVVA
jgi:ribosome biogenesis ATPase